MRESEVSIQFRMKENTHFKLKEIARTELRSLNSQIEYYVLKGIQAYEKEHGAISMDNTDAFSR